MADIIDEQGDQIQLTDEYGNPVHLTDEYGRPMHLIGVATTSTTAPVETELGGPKTAVPGGCSIGDEHKQEKVQAAAASKPEHDGDDHIHKQEKVAENNQEVGESPATSTAGGSHRFSSNATPAGSTTASSEDDGEGGRTKEEEEKKKKKKKKGLKQKIKEKLAIGKHKTDQH